MDLEALSATLPAGWRAMLDPSSNEIYFGNLSTKVRGSSISVECDVPTHGSFIMFRQQACRNIEPLLESWGLPAVKRPPPDRHVQETSWERPT